MTSQTRLEIMTDPRIDPTERRWAERCLTPMPVKEALAKAPWLKGQILLNAEGKPTQPFFFRCSNFDEETRRCTDYENRPSMCRGFPWYDGPPRGDGTLPPDCSFRQDLVQITPKPGRTTPKKKR